LKEELQEILSEAKSLKKKITRYIRVDKSMQSAMYGIDGVIGKIEKAIANVQESE